MKLYPYIGEGKNSGSIALIYDKAKCITLESKTWASDDLELCEGINERFFKNITAEYLANTYGEVKNKEHAEFIKLLAETNKIPCAVVSIDMNYTMFYVIDGCLFFCVKDIDAVGDYKKITIPLPPECEVRKPKEVIANGRKHTLNSVTGFYDFSVIDLGYAAGSTLEKLQEADDYQVISFVDDDSLDDEWPKVGDEVYLKCGSGIIKLPKDNEGFYIVEVNGGYTACKAYEMKKDKPKTEDEILAEELIAKYRHLSKTQQVHAIATDIINNAISRYNITKKPQ